MRNRSLGGALVLAAVLVIAVPPFARGQEPAGRPMARNLAEMKLEPVPGMPACAPGAVLSGDPTKGPSVIIGKLAAGCSIPWHYHVDAQGKEIPAGEALKAVPKPSPTATKTK